MMRHSKITKPIRNALDERYPLYWRHNGGYFELRAVTVANENGTIRSRLLYRTKHYPTAEAISESIYDSLREFKNRRELGLSLLEAYDQWWLWLDRIVR